MTHRVEDTEHVAIGEVEAESANRYYFIDNEEEKFSAEKLVNARCHFKNDLVHPFIRYDGVAKSEFHRESREINKFDSTSCFHEID